MSVHALVEITARPGQLDDVLAPARAFLGEARRKEQRLEQANGYVIQGKTTLLLHLVFEDALAAEEHRSKTHTVRFTETIEDICEAFDVHQLDPLPLEDA